MNSNGFETVLSRWQLWVSHHINARVTSILIQSGRPFPLWSSVFCFYPFSNHFLSLLFLPFWFPLFLSLLYLFITLELCHISFLFSSHIASHYYCSWYLSGPLSSSVTHFWGCTGLIIVSVQFEWVHALNIPLCPKILEQTVVYVLLLTPPFSPHTKKGFIEM